MSLQWVEEAGADLELQAAARRAGARTGRQIAAEAAAGPDPAQPVQQVLAARGYEPYRDGDALRLRNCPFANLSAAPASGYLLNTVQRTSPT